MSSIGFVCVVILCYKTALFSHDHFTVQNKQVSVRASCCLTVKHQVMFSFCCVKSTNRTKALLPIYSLSYRFELTRIYMETMTTTPESADKSTASKIFKCGQIRGQHIILGAVIAVSANICLHYGQPGEKPVDKGFWHCQ